MPSTPEYQTCSLAARETVKPTLQLRTPSYLYNLLIINPAAVPLGPLHYGRNLYQFLFLRISKLQSELPLYGRQYLRQLDLRGQSRGGYYPFSPRVFLLLLLPLFPYQDFLLDAPQEPRLCQLLPYQREGCDYPSLYEI